MGILGEMNWSLIFSLVALSAVVAYVGDRLGMRIGKRRISVLGLRPKHTSSVVTAFTGVLITVVTLGVLSATSDTVRTALFSMKMVQRQIAELTSQLQDSREEYADLEKRLFDSQGELIEKQRRTGEAERALAQSSLALKAMEEQVQSAQERASRAEETRRELEQDRDKLQTERAALQRDLEGLQDQRASLEREIEDTRQRLMKVREGWIVARAGEVVAQGPLEAGADGAALRRALEHMKARARLFLHRNMPAGEPTPEVVLPEGAESQVESYLETHEGQRVALRLVVSANALRGEAVQVRLEPLESKKIYEAGAVLATKTFPASMDKNDAELALSIFLRDVGQEAAARGVLRNPLTGDVGEIDAGDLAEGVRRLTASAEPVEMAVVTLGEIFTEGPLRVKLRAPES